jgi:hypothetical protein
MFENSYIDIDDEADDSDEDPTFEAKDFDDRWSYVVFSRSPHLHSTSPKWRTI